VKGSGHGLSHKTQHWSYGTQETYEKLQYGWFVPGQNCILGLLGCEERVVMTLQVASNFCNSDLV
jgi:hypothetical protein